MKKQNEDLKENNINLEIIKSKPRYNGKKK